LNCHHARQLISPYLDHQLTGREMLALQDHFAVCASCDRERHSIRQLKALLRGLQEPSLPRGFSGGIALRLEQMEAGPAGWRVLCLPPPKPQRGRRLATALALSCLTMLSVVAPFAPDVRNAERVSSSLLGSYNPALDAAPNAVFSERMPERITWVTASDLTLLPSDQPSALPRGGSLMLTGLDTAPVQSGLEMPGRTAPNSSFGSVQLAAYASR
jgi:hypothetical protein